MATNTLIMGESGTGKSTSMRTLNPKETFVINVLDKPLPFKGYKNNYVKFEKGLGNYFASDNYSEILRVIQVINKQRKDINSVIIDDFQYVMANEYMRRARETGFSKFTEITQHAWEILITCAAMRDDLHFFILSHTELDQAGKSKAKTIGKMMDSTVTMEGMFTLVLHSLIVDGKYKLLTQNDGTHIAKSPAGMFNSELIDNDLLFVKNKIDEYFIGDISNVKTEDKSLEEFDKSGITKTLQKIKEAPSLAQLKEFYIVATDLYKEDSDLLSQITAAKEYRKKILIGDVPQ